MTDQELQDRADELLDQKREASRRMYAERTPEARAIHVAKQRDTALRRQYGITLAEFEILDTGRCWACDTDSAGGPGGNTTFCVDHDHETGEVRAILCYACNTGIGKLGDTVEALEQVVRVLQQGPAIIAAKLAEHRETTPYTGPATREKYDWDKILDGTERAYVASVDFDCTAKSFTQHVRETAIRRNINVRTRTNWDGSISVQAMLDSVDPMKEQR